MKNYLKLGSENWDGCPIYWDETILMSWTDATKNTDTSNSRLLRPLTQPYDAVHRHPSMTLIDSLFSLLKL